MAAGRAYGIGIRGCSSFTSPVVSLWSILHAEEQLEEFERE